MFYFGLFCFGSSLVPARTHANSQVAQTCGCAPTRSSARTQPNVAHLVGPFSHACGAALAVCASVVAVVVGALVGFHTCVPSLFLEFTQCSHALLMRGPPPPHTYKCAHTHTHTYTHTHTHMRTQSLDSDSQGKHYFYNAQPWSHAPARTCTHPWNAHHDHHVPA